MIKRLDQKIAIISLSLSFLLLIVAIRFNTGYGLSFTLLILSLLYLLYGKKIKIDDLLNDISSKNSYIILNKLHISIFTVIFFIIFIFIFFISYQSYGRPIIVFVTFCIMAGLIFFEILFRVRSNRFVEILLMVQICILILATSLTYLYSFDVMGSDVFIHKLHIENISQFNTLNAVHGSYSNYPLYHLLGSITSQVSSLSTKPSIIIISVLPYLLGIWILFITIKKYFSSTVGLISVLFLTGNKWFLFWGSFTTPMSMVFLIFTIFIYLIFNRSLSISKTIILSIIFSIFTIFIHPLGPVIVIILLVSIVLPFRVIKLTKLPINYSFISKSKISLLWILSLFIGLFTLMTWIYFGQTFRNIIQTLFLYSQKIGGVLVISSSKSILNYELDNINLYLLYFFIGFGIFYWIRNIMKYNDKNNQLKIMIISPGILLVVIGYLLWIIYLPLVSHRWIFFGLILLIVPFSYGFVQTIKKINYKKIIFLVFFTLLFFFSGVINTEYNVDNPLYNTHVSNYNFRSSEWLSMQYAIEKIPNEDCYGLTVDWEASYYYDYLEEFYSWNLTIERHEWIEEKFQPRTSHFIVREIYYSRLLIPGKLFNINTNNLLISTSSINRFYENGQSSLYHQQNYCG